MATEVIYADASLAGDCSTPDNALGAADSTFTDNTGNDSWTERWSFPSPSGDVSSNNQTLGVNCVKDNPTGSAVTFDVDLYEAGAFVKSLGTGYSVPSSAGWVDMTTFFSDADLSDVSGVDVEIFITVHAAGGSPSNRGTMQVDAIRWQVDYVAATTYPISMAATAVGSAGITFVDTFAVTMDATAIGVATLSRLQTFVKTLAATAIGVPTLIRKQFIAMDATAIGVPSLVRKQFVSMTATAVGVADLALQAVIGVTLAATAVGVAGLTKATTFVKSLPATAVGAAMLTRKQFVALAATAIGNASMVRKQFVTLTATAVGVADMALQSVIGFTLAATAVGVAGLTKSLTLVQTLTAAVVGIAGLAKVFTPGGGAPAVVRSMFTMVRRVGRRLIILRRSRHG